MDEALSSEQLIAFAGPIIESLEATGRKSAARIMVALCEALERRAWLPIPPDPVPGVAPWDGEQVDLWWNGSRWADCYWNSHAQAFEHNQFGRTRVTAPTYYAPLPPPPALEDGR